MRSAPGPTPATRRSTRSSSKPYAIVLDLAGHRVQLSSVDVQYLQAETERHSGRSSVARDLSLLLARPLGEGGILVLRRTEARTLARIAAQLGLTDLAVRIVT